MNNSVHGKSMEHLGKWVKVKLVNNGKDYEKYAIKLIFVSPKIFTKFVFLFMKSTNFITLDKPIYVGSSILDLSKLLIDKFHYKYMEQKIIIVFNCF